MNDTSQSAEIKSCEELAKSHIVSEQKTDYNQEWFISAFEPKTFGNMENTLNEWISDMYVF